MIQNQINHDHLVGIKGVGMTALASCLVDFGNEVSGVDYVDDFITNSQLQSLNIPISDNFESLPNQTNRVIISSAFNPDTTPLTKIALKRQIPVVTHAQALAKLVESKKVVAICGVGGKSTVSAMLAYITQKLGLFHSYAVGVGEIIGLPNTGYFNPNSEYMIIEADEYADNPYMARNVQTELIPRFSYFYPTICVCTNLKFDHPDVYKSIEHTEQKFFDFFMNIQPNGYLIWNYDDHLLQKLVGQIQKNRKDITYLSFGLDGGDKQITAIQSTPGLTSAIIDKIKIELVIPGNHNLLNTAAALAAAETMQIDSTQAASALRQFSSTSRRCQLIRQRDDLYFYDDYAHHPSEIVAILQAFRSWFPHHWLVAIFEPHTFSRTQALLNEFVQALLNCDQLIMLPTFSSAREAQSFINIDSQMFSKISSVRSNMITQFSANYSQVKSLIDFHKSAQVILTLGAGTVYKIHDIIMDT